MPCAVQNSGILKASGSCVVLADIAPSVANANGLRFPAVNVCGHVHHERYGEPQRAIYGMDADTGLGNGKPETRHIAFNVREEHEPPI